MSSSFCCLSLYVCSPPGRFPKSNPWIMCQSPVCIVSTISSCLLVFLFKAPSNYVVAKDGAVMDMGSICPGALQHCKDKQRRSHFKMFVCAGSCPGALQHGTNNILHFKMFVCARACPDALQQCKGKQHIPFHNICFWLKLTTPPPRSAWQCFFLRLVNDGKGSK